jgi:hypothetical protein
VVDNQLEGLKHSIGEITVGGATTHQFAASMANLFLVLLSNYCCKFNGIKKEKKFFLTFLGMPRGGSLPETY